VDHFFDDLQPALQRLGYTGLFVRKPLNADGTWPSSPPSSLLLSPSFSGDVFYTLPLLRLLPPSLPPSGAATFVKTSSLEVVSSHAYSYLEEEEEEGEGGSEGGVRSRPSNQVALAVMVRNRKGRGRRKGEEEEEEKGRREEWLVVNTHLKAVKTAAGEQVRTERGRERVGEARKAHMAGHVRPLLDDTLTLNPSLPFFFPSSLFPSLPSSRYGPLKPGSWWPIYGHNVKPTGESFPPPSLPPSLPPASLFIPLSLCALTSLPSLPLPSLPFLPLPSRAHGRSLPVLLCGDFNAAPHDKEGRVTSPSLPPSSSPPLEGGGGGGGGRGGYRAECVPLLRREGFESVYDLEE